VNRGQDEGALRVQAQQATLFALLKSGIPTALAPEAWKALTEATAKTLAVRRVSIWLLDAKRERLILQDLYDAKTGRHASSLTLEAQQYPAYFQALRWSRAIVAPDAATDPHTKEFADAYLVPLDIVSLMDAGIWRGGEARGVVCLESVGERRAWTFDEQQFTGSIADLAASVLDNEALRAARTHLEESETLFARALRSSPDWISVVRIDDGVILHVNDAFERESGFTAAEVVGKPTIAIGLWADPSQRAQWIERVRKEVLVREFEVDFLTKGGVRRTFLLSGHRVEIGGQDCVVTSSRDISDLKRRERLVRDIARGVGAAIGESFFRSLVDHLAGALDADLAFVGELGRDAGTVRTAAVNEHGAPARDFEYTLDGSPCETVLGQGICAYPRGVAAQFPRDRVLAEKGIESYVGAPLHDAAGKPLGLVAVLFKRPIADVALVENLLRIFAARASAEMERRRQLRSLEYQARYDPLTGLVNRVQLREIVEQGMAANVAAGRRGALLLLDLDRFKEVNDTLGHHVGDALLIRLSRRLEREMASGWGGQVGRLGGDEFGVWIGDLARDEFAEIAAARALAAITAPLEIEGYRLEVGASVGIAIAPDHGTTPSALLRCADVAMYDAKRQGSGFSVYNVTLDPYSEERLGLLTELGGAMGRGEMRVHYQPRRHLATGRTSGFEALARWQHPRLGLLGPGKFVPLAELSDVIRPLTLWVLETALKQRCAWNHQGGVMAVNLSARHLLDDSCPEQIGRVISQAGADPSMLELEITESGLIADPDRAQVILERIRDMGVSIAIDDFGTGYSSLSHLKRLPLHTLKIDVSFVRQMLASPADRAIVESTIGLAHQLGLSVAAEGIENSETLEKLRSRGCDEGQGYFIGRPMPAAEATAWMASH